MNNRSDTPCWVVGLALMSLLVVPCSLVGLYAEHKRLQHLENRVSLRECVTWGMSRAEVERRLGVGREGSGLQGQGMLAQPDRYDLVYYGSVGGTRDDIAVVYDRGSKAAVGLLYVHPRVHVAE